MPAPEQSRAQAVLEAIAALRGNAAAQPSAHPATEPPPQPAVPLTAASLPHAAPESLPTSAAAPNAPPARPATAGNLPHTAAGSLPITAAALNAPPARPATAANLPHTATESLPITAAAPSSTIEALPAAVRGAQTQPAAPDQKLAAHSGDARQLITALRATALILSDVREPIALTLRQELQVETGLSLPMIEWGLLTSLASLRHAPLSELAATRPANAPRELIGVILAGNVFVAAVRGIALPLLAGAHVIAKTSTREGALARAFHAALTQADKTIAARLAIVQFPREDEAATRALCTSVDALSVYGSDETVEQLRRLSATEPHSNAHANGVAHGNAQTIDQSSPASATEHPHSNAHANGVVHGNAQTVNQPSPAAAASPRCALHESATSDDRAHSGRAPAFRTSGAPRIIAHGHGLSAAYVAQSVLQSSEQAAHAAERIALDIAAYDQRGCLSPHFVLVEPGATITPQAFAQLLAAQALPALAQLLPPGEATLDEQADRMQWQATAAVRGELYAHATHAVSVEPAPARPSPGGRLISVYACESQAQLRELLEPFARHLKCLGVAGSKAERTSISDQLKAFCTAQVCRSGEMQTPAFDAWADGAPPLAGLFPA